MYKLILISILVLLSSCRLLTDNERIEFVVWLVGQGYVDQKDCLIVDGCLEIDDTDTVAVAAPNTPPGMKFANWEIKQKGEPNACAGLYDLCAFDSTKYRGNDIVEVFLAENGPYVNVNPTFEEADMDNEPANQCLNFKPYQDRFLEYRLRQSGINYRVEIDRKAVGLSVDGKGEVHRIMRELVGVYKTGTENQIAGSEAQTQTTLNPNRSLNYIRRDSEQTSGGPMIEYRNGRRTYFNLTLSDPIRNYFTTVVETVNGVATEIPVNYGVEYRGHTRLIFTSRTEGHGCVWEETQTANHPVLGLTIFKRTTVLGGNDTDFAGEVVSQIDISPEGEETRLDLGRLRPGDILKF